MAVVVAHQLILGGQRSGKSRCAELRAAAWLEACGNSALLLATATAGDAEMTARIAQHRVDRTQRVPGLATLEVAVDLASAITTHSAPQRLIVVDCLTLWLTNLLMPLHGAGLDAVALAQTSDALAAALADARGPVLFVSNEIGLGLVPMTREARRFVDELGRLHQRLGAICANVTLMVAGIEVPVKVPVKGHA